MTYVPGLVKAIFEAMPATTRSPIAEVTPRPDSQSSRQTSTDNRCDLALEDEEFPDISKQLIITSVNIAIIASHIPRVQNASADMLSRNQTEKFLLKHSQSSRTPVLISSPLVQMVSQRSSTGPPLTFFSTSNSS